MNDAVPLWNQGDAALAVDGVYIGLAHAVRAETSTRKLWLDGLDPLAMMFFSGLVGRAGENGTRVGELLIGDPLHGQKIEAGGAWMDDFSSGTHHVSLVVEKLELAATTNER